VVNADKDTNQFLKVVFIPNYNVKLAEVARPTLSLARATRLVLLVLYLTVPYRTSPHRTVAGLP